MFRVPSIIRWDSGIRLALQQAREVGGVGGEHARQAQHIVRDFRQVLEVRLVHRLADPITGRLGGDRPAGVVERLNQLGGDMMGAVFIADDPNNNDLPEARHPALLVRLAEKGVHALNHALGEARRLAKPDRRPEDQDVGIENAAPDVWPGVARSLVRRYSGLDVMIGDPNRFRELDAVAGELGR